MNRVLVHYGLPALILEGTLVGLAVLETPFQSLAAFLLLCVAAFAAYLAAAHHAWKDEEAGRGTVLFLFAAGVVFRVTLLPFPHSDDMNRYLWEGRLQAHGLNPYAHAPDSPAAAHLRDTAVYPEINGKQYVSFYPPLAQLLFLAAGAISHTFIMFKIVFTAFDILTGIFLLLLLDQGRAPPGRVLLYLWCPQLVFSIAGRGHLDSMQACLMVLALLLFKKNRVPWSAFVLGLAILSKTLTLLLLPVFFVHAERRRDLWPCLLPLLLAIPYLNAGYGMVQSLFMFGFSWTTNASLFTVLTLNGTFPCLVHLSAVAAYLVVLLRARRVEDAAFAVWACFLMFTPTLHPWYLTGVFPFLALRWRPAWLLLSCTLFLYYTFWMTGAWAPIPWIPLLEYIPFYGLLIQGQISKWNKKPESPFQGKALQA